jgi:hypothetical protein
MSGLYARYARATVWTKPRKIGLAVVVGAVLLSQVGPPVYDHLFGQEYWCDTNYRVETRCVGHVPRWRARELSDERYRRLRADAARIAGGPEDFIVRLLRIPGDEYGYGPTCFRVLGQSPSATLREKMREVGINHESSKCRGDGAVIVTIDKISPMGPDTVDVMLYMHCGWLCGRSAQWTVRRASDGTLSIVERVHGSIS